MIPSIQAALAVSLGGLGVLTRITFACESIFNLRLEQTPALLDETLERLDEHNCARHFGFWWFPRTNRVVLRRFTKTDRPADTASPMRDWMRNVVVRNQIHQLLLLGASVAGIVPVGMANDLMFGSHSATPALRQAVAVTWSLQRYRFCTTPWSSRCRSKVQPQRSARSAV